MVNQLSLLLEHSTAEISACGKYRFSLSRIWDTSKPKVFWLMHNPSTADAEYNDPTIRRIINYSKSWGFGGIMVGNLSPYRATNPEILTILEMDEIRPLETFGAIDKMVRICKLHILAYGNPIDDRLLMLLPDVKWHALKVTEAGNPCHPLYLKKELVPISFPS